MNSTAADEPFADGFLSGAVRDLRPVVRSMYADVCNLAADTNREAVSLQHALQIHSDQLSQALGAALFARTLAFTQSTAIMLEHGMPVQARTLLRAGLETMFQLGALAEDETVGPAIVASQDADKRTLADRIARWKDPSLRASIRSSVSDQELAAMASGPGKPTNIFELAKVAKMEDWYLTVYTLLSFAAHSKVSDLDRHIVVDDQGEPIAFRNEPELDEQGPLWAWIIEVQTLSMQSVSRIFDLPTTRVLELRDRLAALT